MQSASAAILLCTFNGARFLPQQLASYEAQGVADWRLFVSDDGSEDSTLAILEEFRKKHGPQRVQIRQGPRQGFVANFLSLICDPAIRAGCYALSDQDDVWLPHKLSRAQSFLATAPAGIPFVYCSRTQLIDDAGRKIGLSPLFTKPPEFRNALTQSIAGGNTMMLNEKAREILIRAGADVNTAGHDWWTYLAITAVGGQFCYDREPTVCYRIHSHNVMGANRSLTAQLMRAQMLARGCYRSWTDMNVAALERIEDLMTDDNRKIFDLFRRSRQRSTIPRAYGLIRCGIYRQTPLGNLGLATAALFGRI
jgi:hypothetical protein